MNDQANNNMKKEKKLYQRWWIWVIGLIALLIIFRIVSTSVDKARTKEIPNVMGINYTDAETVLNENGFRITTVEADAESILSNGIYDRSVKKGEVFKVNNETNPDYTYETTKNKNVTIYYAQDDYTYIEAEPTPTQIPAVAAAEDTDDGTEDTSAVSADWRQFLNDYENWVDSYIAFMKKYKENPTDTTLISEYAEFVSGTAEWSEKAKQYEDGLKDMSPADVAEYTKRIGEILQKFNELG